MTSTDSRRDRIMGEPLELGVDFMADPHARYPLLRGERPVVSARTPRGTRIWLVTRYGDVRAALNDPRLSKDAARLEELLRRQNLHQERRSGFGLELAWHMLNSDPPDHTRLRKLVNRAFTGRAIAALRPRVQAIADELADAMAARARAGEHTVDLLDAFAFPLPLTVICELLGVATRDRGDFRAWTNALLSTAPAGERKAAVVALAQFMTRLVEDKRAHPGDDMLSEVVRATEDGIERLSVREAVSMAFLLLVAGHETTVNLIGNGTLALLRHPDRLAELRADPDLTPSAVEELLRYDGPLNLATFRHTTESVTIAGTEIPAGEIVLVSLASANRDPDRYDRPDELDLRREAPHLAFGYGIHHCLGAPLARLEGDVAFRTLLSRFPALSLAAEPAELRWRDSMLIRGLTTLPVRLTPG